MEVPSEVTELSKKLVARYGIVRYVDETFYTRALKEALPYRGCYYTFWNSPAFKCLVVYRLDRLPNNEECLPFVQECFNIACGPTGETQEIGRTAFSRHFVEGSKLYTVTSMADSMGNMLANYADKKDEVEQFDLDETSTGKRMLRHLRNGRS